MSLLFVIVKGDRNAAQATRIAPCLRWLHSVATSDNGLETYCYASIHDMPKIIRWFCEPYDNTCAAPIGSCMWYAEHRVEKRHVMTEKVSEIAS